MLSSVTVTENLYISLTIQLIGDTWIRLTEKVLIF